MRIHRIIYLILISCAVAATTGCTSKKIDQEPSEISELAGDSEGEDFEADSSEDELGLDDSSKVAAEDEAAALPDEATAATGDEEQAANPEELTSDLDEQKNSEATDVAAGNAEEKTEEKTADDAQASAADVPPATDEYAAGTDESQGLSEPEPPKRIIPLQKMVSAPYKRGSKNINTIYVAREGDTTTSVSKKIFGKENADELKKDNPTFARREMKVGDKVYYSSPKRPDDESAMLTYYEDMGLTPEVYLSQPGDNIRTVAQNLLGHPDSWKEIWALNPDVESKGDLPEGTRLRYWPKDAGGVAAPVVADNEGFSGDVATSTPPETDASGTATGTTETAAPPMPEDTMPPPPVAEVAPPPPPIEAAPPPVAEVAPPPPVAEVTPPPPQAASNTAAFGDDPDQMMALGAGAILLLAAVALFIIIRKKRARRNAAIDFQTASHTQIE